MLLAVPVFMMSWLLGDGRMPVALPAHALWSIAYLGVVGSVVSGEGRLRELGVRCETRASRLSRVIPGTRDFR
jgi:hypothetical protein